MTRMLLILSALLALSSLALADKWNVGENQATVTERINLTIPQKVALHLTEDEWILDLNNPLWGTRQRARAASWCPRGTRVA